MCFPPLLITCYIYLFSLHICANCLGYIYTSPDTGVTWTIQYAAGYRSWVGITSSSDGAKIAAGVNGGIYIIFIAIYIQHSTVFD